MSEVLGVKIEYAPTSIEEFKRKMEELYKLPPFLVQHLVEVAQNYREASSLAQTMPSRKSPESPRCRSKLSSRKAERFSPDEQSRAPRRPYYVEPFARALIAAVNRRRKTGKIAPPQGVMVSALSSFRAVPKLPS
jgi:hypothetical protein